MSIVEIIPLVENTIKLLDISKDLDGRCVFIDVNNQQELDESFNFTVTDWLSIKMIDNNINYHIRTTYNDELYLSAFDYLEDNNIFNLDISCIENLWRSMDLKIFNLSSSSMIEYHEDYNFIKLVEIITKNYKGVISVNEYIPKIPEYLYSIEEWQNLIKVLSKHRLSNLPNT